MSLLHHLDQAPAARAAFVCGGEVLHYGALQRQTRALAAWLMERHRVQRGDRVLVLAANHPRVVVAVYALWRAGAVVVPLNPSLTATEIAFHAEDSGARLALTDDALADKVSGTDPIVRALPIDRAVADAERAALRFDVPPPTAGAHCVLPYTSGTTGRPKGCVHTQATLLASLRSSARWRGYTASTVFLGNTPLFHMQGFQNAMNLPVMLGATAVMQPRWNPDDAAALIERHRVSAWSAAPTMLIDLFASPSALQRDLSSLDLVSGGGAALPEPVAAALFERYGLVYNEAYGMTETASFLHANPVGGGHRGCLGLATDGVDSRIVDPDSGAELPAGMAGELVTHAPQVMQRYWHEGLQPQANDGAFVTLNHRRYLRTGDLAERDADGYFFLRDRLKRMINSAGFKVWPAEVEAHLHRHPAVREACVVAMPDARRGEAVKAVVVLEAGAVLAEAELIAWARETLAHYKVPQAVEFRAALPRSATGKTAWRELQAQQRRQDA